ncbi:sulfite exporter TauE/SafE family protein [Aliiglaciecola sp. LCG003]|uniref:sulfite exporter TauE/SafE family protein n=1 Tax=Aliiglaciecola sp. LCG003 TaxID=3053655 RepID=UPI00257478AE|nr:sulfite exporter TauE/SafE family protein [Aliiglaciecola sp. LCG003]WJG10284.1 sulfite exporter TauE/SafE family protein [Aliiglaciecola sp. LCG003]
MTFLVVAIGVFVAFTIEAMTGFGSIVIALSIGALVMDIPVLVQWLVPLNILMTAPLVWRLRNHIARNFLLTQILPFMALGTLIGVLLTGQLPELYGKGLFALLICWFAGRSLAQMQAANHGSILRKILIFSAGITHGLFASGGPLLVYASAKSGLDKTQFRATLLSVWLSLNGALTIWFAASGTLQQHASHILMLVPVVLVGALLGNFLHHKVSQQQFTRIVFSVLLLVGVLLLLKTASQIFG